MSQRKKTYKAAYQRLEEIANQIDNNEVEIDQLAELIKEAKDLKKFCDGVLKQTKQDIEESLSKDEDKVKGPFEEGPSGGMADTDDLPF
jgi:exodeoxyribonuclease VII small subunit